MRFFARLVLGGRTCELGVERITLGKSSFEINDGRLKVRLNPVSLCPRGIAFGLQTCCGAARKKPTNDAAQHQAKQYNSQILHRSSRHDARNIERTILHWKPF